MLADLSPIFAALIGVFLVARLLRWRQPLGLGLSPEGIYHWSWFGGLFIPWESVKAVRAVEKRGYVIAIDCRESEGAEDRDPADSWLARFGFFQHYMQRINAGYLAVDPALAHHALLFYHRNPDRRSELGSDDGGRRLRQADFPGLFDRGWGAARET